MLRIHFTLADLAGIRIARRPDPLWEVLMSVYLLRKTRAEMVLGGWRSQTRQRLTPSTRPLLDLVPASGSSPDFLTPPGGGTLSERIDSLLSTPRSRLTADFAHLARERPLPSWTVDLAEGRPPALRMVAHALRGYFHACLEPHWDAIATAVRHDHTRRAQLMADQGIDAVLSTLSPAATWRFPVLSIDYLFDQDVRLDGRGLLLQPVVFGRGPNPTTLIDPALPPVLVYSVPLAPGVITPAEPARRRAADPIVALLGTTRTRILRALDTTEATTTELARRAATPLPTASRHATALRDANLITSHRHKNMMIHAITPLGTALLRGRQPHLN